ncbi:hypothetical protein GCM10029964_092230 [Kibdelosporangium lantanae]
MTTTYVEVAAADGAWACPVLLPPTDFGLVRTVLMDLATSTGVPVAALAYGGAGELVTQLLLVRDPSRTYGTPNVEICQALAEILTATTGWPLVTRLAPRSGCLATIGLREGFTPGAVEHAPQEIDALLARQNPATHWQTTTVRILSARYIDRTTTRWYDEVGVLVHADHDLSPLMGLVALATGQRRFVITDLTAGRTRAFAQAGSQRDPAAGSTRLGTGSAGLGEAG